MEEDRPDYAGAVGLKALDLGVAFKAGHCASANRGGRVDHTVRVTQSVVTDTTSVRNIAWKLQGELSPLREPTRICGEA